MSSLKTHHFVYTFPSIRSDADGKSVLDWRDGVPPFHADLEMDTNHSLDMIWVLAGAFTADECCRIVEIGGARPKTAGGLAGHREGYRDSHVAWIDPHPDTHWLFHKIAALFNDVNTRYEFELLGLIEPLQYTTYGAGQHYGWHKDVGAGRTCVRKLSMTVQLSELADYEGGDLEFLDLHDQGPQRGLGTMIVFPSFAAHRVTPVTSGLRRSLVAWACGPSFR